MNLSSAIENTFGMVREYAYITVLQFLDLVNTKPPEEWNIGDKGNVILIPGFNEKLNHLKAIGDVVNKAGYKVYYFKEQGRFKSVEDQTKIIEAQIEKLKLDRFSLIGHSKGSLVCKNLLISHTDKINHVITIAGAWQGSVFGHLGVGGFLNLDELRPGTELIRTLGKPEPINQKVLNIRSKIDNHVPFGRDTLPDSREVKTDIVGHTVIMFEESIKQMVLDELES